MRLILVAALILAGCAAPDEGEPAADRIEGEETIHAPAHEAGSANDLGAVDFQVSCASEVSEDFNRAVALLHHMMYEEARSAFEEVAEHDPDCAMAYWGIAMSRFQPLWPGRPEPEDRERGWEAVERAKTLGPESDRNQALVQAVEAFWDNPESDEWWSRIERWGEAMEEAYAERPDDLETAAFYTEVTSISIYEFVAPLS